MGDYDRRLAQAQDFADGWQQRAEAAEAERDRLRESARLANIAADAAAEAVGNMAERCSALLAEQERLRALAFLVYRTLSDEPIDSLEWLTPEHRDLLAQVVSDLSPHLNPERVRTAMQDVVDERDRLRAVLRAVMTETGTSSLAYHYARDALAGSAETTDE